MKTIRQLAFLLCTGLLLFGSCRKSVPPHLKAIPSDAAFVLTFKNKQLTGKSGLNNLKDCRFFQKMRDRMNIGDEEAQKMIDKFLENPKSSGLSLDQSYLFAVKQGEGFFGATVFEMDNATAFEASLKGIMQGNTEFHVEDKGAYKIAQSDGVTMAWNRELLIAGSGKDCGTVNYDDFFARPQEKSIVSVIDFNDFNKHSYDIGFWASYDAITDLASPAAHVKKTEIWKELSDTYIHSYLCFENGEARLSSVMTPPSKVKDFFVKYPVFKKDFDNSLLRAFPDKSYLAYKLSLNVPEYIQMVREVSKQMDAGSPIDRMMLKNPVANTIINGLGGDMILSVYDFARSALPVPLSGLTFTVKSKDDFDKMLAMVPQEMVKQDGEHYVVSTGMTVSVYFAYRDNKVYVTDDVDAMAAFTGKGFDRHMTVSSLGKSLEKSLCLFYINLDADSYPESVRSLLQSGLGGIADESLKFLKPYRDFSLSIDHDYELVFSLRFKDTGQNSLKQILKNIDEIAASQN
ncbi:MAG: DUF4836 family protein [Bacteroidales bacterium]|jgi:hypothetical protein|nr:DUF4836 family protein [Bacteroidales bacterium]